MDKPRDLQSQVSRHLRAARHFSAFPSLLARRLRRFDSDNSEALATRATALLRALFRDIRPGVIADLFASWLNAWCVSARFGQDRPCRFCSSCGPDSIDCLWRCPVIRSTIFPMLRIDAPHTPVDALALSRASRDVTILRVLAVHLVRSAHNTIRAHSIRVTRDSLWRIFLTRFRKLPRDSPRGRALLLRAAPAAGPPPLAL